MNPTERNTHIDEPKVPKLGEESPKEAVPSDDGQQQPEKRDNATQQRIRDMRSW